MVETLDYLVVGAGPAGAMAARSLARRGRRVALLDWRSEREKPCGGGVPHAGMRRFGALLAGVPRREVRDVRLVSAEGAETRLALEQPLTVFARREFDEALRGAATAAGAERIAARATRLLRDGEEFRVTLDHGADATELRTRFVVAADGARGAVRRHLLGLHARPPLDAAQFSRSFTTYPRVAADTPLEIAWLPGGDGYAWTFPRVDHASVGICLQGERGGQEELRARLAGLIAAGRLTGDPVAPGVGALIPSYRDSWLDSAPVEGPGFCLVGDAAGAVDPITREGIHHALVTGDRVGACDPLASPGAYARWFDAELRPVLRASAAWAPRFFSPRFLATMVGLLGDSAPLRRVFSDLVAGTQDCRGLERRLWRSLPSCVPWLVRRSWRSVWRAAPRPGRSRLPR